MAPSSTRSSVFFKDALFEAQDWVKWKGYTETENSWVNFSDVNAPELLAGFKSLGST